MDTYRGSVSWPGQWAEHHFGSVDLKDQRLNRRVVQVAAAMAGDAAASIPAQQGTWKATKAAYRMFDQPAATFPSLCAGHWQQTRALARRCAAVVLLIQDTTWLDFGSHPATQGLGWCLGGQSKTGDYGLFLHSVLAVTPPSPQQNHARVLGLMHAKLWARQGEAIGRGKGCGGKRRRRRKSTPSESLRWSQAVEQVASPPESESGRVRWIHVGDREADIFQLYRTTAALAGVGFVIRVKQNRTVSQGHGPPQGTRSLQMGLKDLARGLKAKTRIPLPIPARERRRAGQAELSVGFCPVTLDPPARRGQAEVSSSLGCCSVRCWCVRVWEKKPPPGEEAIEWILLSSEPVHTIEQALTITGWYTQRWLIEEYHQCLKTGCQVEQRQLQTMERLSAVIGMLAVAAVRLLQMKSDARVPGEHSPQSCGVRRCFGSDTCPTQEHRRPANNDAAVHARGGLPRRLSSAQERRRAGLENPMERVEQTVADPPRLSPGHQSQSNLWVTIRPRRSAAEPTDSALVHKSLFFENRSKIPA